MGSVEVPEQRSPHPDDAIRVGDQLIGTVEAMRLLAQDMFRIADNLLVKLHEKEDKDV